MCVIPLGYLVLRASDGGWAKAVELVVDGRTAALLARSTALAVAVVLTTVAIGVPLAWLVDRTDLPLRRTIAILTALPLAVPSYVAALAVITAFGPRGALTKLLAPLGVDQLPALYGPIGAWLAISFCSFPYVTLTVRAGLRRLDPALEEAARSLGLSPRQAFLRVTLPLLRPAIGAGSLLVALYTLADFGAVGLLQFDSFTRVVFQQYRGAIDRSAAAVLALVLVCLTSLVVGGELWTRGHDRLGSTRPSRPPTVVSLGRWRWPAFATCCTLIAVALIIPVGVLGSWLVSGLRHGDPLGGDLGAIGASARFAALGALAAVSAAWPVAVLSVRHPGRVARLIERAVHLAYSLPGLVVSLALVFFGARVVPALHQTTAMLVLAYGLLFLPQAVGALRAALGQVGLGLEEASRSLGVGPLGTARRVVLPLVRSGLLSGACLVFLTAMKELPAALLLSPTGTETLATQVWSATSEALYGRAAAPALLLIAISSIPLGLMTAFDGRRSAPTRRAEARV